MDALKKDISSVLLPTKEGVQSKHFQSEFAELIGAPIDPKKYGFNSVHELIRSMPDKVQVTNLGPGLYLYKAKVDSTTAGLSQLIDRQKAKKKRSQGGRGRGGRPGGSGGGGRNARFGNRSSGAPNVQRVTNRARGPPVNVSPRDQAANMNRMRDNQSGHQNNNQLRSSPGSSSSRPQSSQKNMNQDIQNNNLTNIENNFKNNNNIVSISSLSLNNDNLRNSFKGTGYSNERAPMNQRLGPLKGPDISQPYHESTRRFKPNSDSSGIRDLFATEISAESVTMMEAPRFDGKNYGHSSYGQSSASQQQQQGRRVSSTQSNAAENGIANTADFENAQQLSKKSRRVSKLAGRKKNPVGSSTSQNWEEDDEEEKLIRERSASCLAPTEKIPTNICLMELAKQPDLSEICRNSPFVLSHSVSPDEFYLQCAAERTEESMDLVFIDQLCTKIMETIGPEVKKLCINVENCSKLQNNECVILSSPAYGVWVRAQIQQKKQFLVDFGRFTESFEPCFRMPQKLYDIPAQAYQCRLYDLYPMQSYWSTEACEAFVQEAELNSLIVQVKQSPQLTSAYSVDIFIDGENLGQILCSIGLAQRQPLVRRVKATSKHEKLPLRYMNRVRLICFETPSVVYVTLTSLEGQLESLNEEIHEVVSQEYDGRSIVRTPKVGEYYICRDADSECTRVKILSIDCESVQVNYEDFGEVNVLPADSKLYPMKPSFYELPFQAIKVVLSDFQSIGENKNVLEQLAEKMLHKEFYLDVLDEVELDDETLLVEIMSIEGDVVTPSDILTSESSSINCIAESLSSAAVSPVYGPYSNFNLEQLEALINDDDEHLHDIRNFVSVPEKEKVYIAFHPTMKKFCRAKVEQQIENTFLLTFFDYSESFHRVLTNYIIDASKYEPKISQVTLY